MKSKKKLFEALQRINPERFPNVAKKQRQAGYISNETYGKKSMIYITESSHEARKKLESQLMDEGFNVQTSYWPGSSVLEVQVSYFKGWHWDQ